MNEELLKIQKKQLRQMRIQTSILCLMLAIILAAGSVVGIAALSVKKTTTNLDFDKINETIAILQDVSKDLNQLDMADINRAIASLADVAETISKADIDAINEAIVSLTGAADNLKDMDVDEINELISSLQKTAAQMERTTSIFSKIFG